jgi:transcriptional regulator with XRE-family HTH domain
MGAGNLLADFRRARRLSQLELGLEAQVSARHISFIENGRAQASRDMLLRLAAALELSHRDSNALLAANGLAQEFSHLNLDDEALAPVRYALNIMLDNHDPLPAAVMDGHWNLLMANKALQTVLELMLPGRPKEQVPMNMLEMVFDARALRPLIVNWEQVASALLRRLWRQAQTQRVEPIRRLYHQLLTMDPPKHWQTGGADDGVPVLTVQLVAGDCTLSLFSTLSTFGTAQDVGLQEITVESYFPADPVTRHFFESLATDPQSQSFSSRR